MTRRIIAARNPDQPARESRIARQGPPRGVTLIEMMILITAVAAMLGLTVIMVQLLLRLDVDSRARFDTAGILARLAEQFRRDVHKAVSARLVEQTSRPALLHIELEPGRAVEYEVKGMNRVIRVESNRGKLVRSESYEIARGGSIELAVKQEERSQFARLTVDRQASKNRTDPPRLFEILVQVGKNRDRLPAKAVTAGGAS
jgi:hypothetical protein